MGLRLLGPCEWAKSLISDPFGSRNILLVPSFHPFRKVAEKGAQFHSLLCKGIFYSRWRFRVDFSLNDLSLIELVQPLSQACSAYALYPSFQLVESGWFFES